MLIGSSSERQLLYYSDRPRYNFPKVTEKRSGKALLRKVFLPPKEPVWVPLAIEFPTRVLASTKQWLREESKRDILIYHANSDDRVLEQWQIKGATPLTQQMQRSRIIDDQVLIVIFRYDWARLYMTPIKASNVKNILPDSLGVDRNVGERQS
jgi:hypothetical protein